MSNDLPFLIAVASPRGGERLGAARRRLFSANGNRYCTKRPMRTAVSPRLGLRVGMISTALS